MKNSTIAAVCYLFIVTIFGYSAEVIGSDSYIGNLSNRSSVSLDRGIYPPFLSYRPWADIPGTGGFR